jgi:hypothetical protein
MSMRRGIDSIEQRQANNRASKYSSFVGGNDYQYTKGKEFTTEDGEEYIGEYHTLKSGATFTGPVEDTNNLRSQKRLYPYYRNDDHFTYDKLFNFHTPQKANTQPIPFLYKPREAEGAYLKGYDLRFFVQRRNAGTFAIEVSGQQYNQIGKAGGIDGSIYAYAAVAWQLTGTLDYIETTNKRNINVAAQQLPALPYAISNYTQFANPSLQTVFNSEDSQYVQPRYKNNAVPIKQTYDRTTGKIIPLK